MDFTNIDFIGKTTTIEIGRLKAEEYLFKMQSDNNLNQESEFGFALKGSVKFINENKIK